MKKFLKYSLLITLTLLIITSLVNAQPVDIGKSTQARPYESNPTVTTDTSIFGTWGNERDGSLATLVACQPLPPFVDGAVILQSFTAPPPAQQFTIGWVDIKIKYQHPGAGDDSYTIGYKTSGAVYANITPTLVGAAAKFDDTAIAAIRPWANVATYPLTGAWTWADVQNLAINITLIRGPNNLWDSFFTLYEVWLTIYEFAPPSSSTAMSVMPGTSNTTITGIVPGKYFFADVYLNGLSGGSGQLWGYQAHIKYDENVVTATSYETYYPFTVLSAAVIGLGNTSVSYTMQSGDLVGFTGTATPLCRIYFQVDSQGGATPLDLIDQRPQYITEFTDPLGGATIPPLYDGWFSSPRYLSAPTLIDLTNPLTTMWHEEYPDYSKIWHLTSWEDESEPFGNLSRSDQIDMTNESDWAYWFHVDEVTITIHYTLKEGEFGPEIPEVNGTAEPEIPTVTMPSGSPIGSKWHVIFPNFSDTFQIASWGDTDLSGNFTPSDQFDFMAGAADVILVPTVAPPIPPVGTPLKHPLLLPVPQFVKFWDANTNGIWDVGESAVWDSDNNGFYIPPGDMLLAGPAPPMASPVIFGTMNDLFWDGAVAVNNWWDVGEPAIRDVDASGTYTLGTAFWAHLDYVSTDIIVSQKPIPPKYTGGVPEFPLGITLLMIIAPIIPLTYLWRLRKKVPKQ